MTASNQLPSSYQGGLFGFGLLEGGSHDPLRPETQAGPGQALAKDSHARITARLIAGLPATGNSQDTSHVKLIAAMQHNAQDLHAESFYVGLTHIARSCQNEGKYSEAAFLYSSLREIIPEHFSQLHAKVQESLLALNGQGRFINRLPLLVQQVWDEFADPIMLTSMGFAQGVFGFARLGLLRGLPGSIAASQGGRLAAANLGAFALEGLAFAGSHRGLAQAFGHVLPEGSLSFAQEVGHAYLTLGLLKSLSGVAGAGVRRYTLPTLERQSLSSLQHLGRFALPQAAMYSGIYLSSAWAPGLGLGENPGDDLALTSLVTLLQFNLSGMVLNKVPGFHRLNQSIQMQTELAIRETGARFRQHLEETFRIPPGMGGEMVPAKGVFMSSDRRQARLDTDFRINRMTATGSSGEGLIDNGPFGKFSREVFAAQGTAVYTPVGDTVTKIPGAKRNVILIAGAWLDHTCFTELPQQIHQRGHGIKIISFPGHEIADPVSLQQRPAKELAESWQRALKETVERLLEKDPSTPVVLGGFSLGGAAALGIYANLDPALQGRISGLILGAPALAFPLLETSVIGPLNRRVLLPLYSRFSEKPVQGPNRYTRSNVPGGLAAHVQFKEERTWSSRHAAVLLGEAARGDLLKLKEHPNLPPVLVIHGGRTDLTVSSRAAELVQETFGKKAHSLNLAKRFSRHLVFVFRGRQRAFDRIHQFLAENK